MGAKASVGLAFWTLLFLQRGVCLFKERSHLNLGAGGQPLVAFALVPQLDFQGPPSPSAGAGSLGHQVPAFGDQMDPKPLLTVLGLGLWHSKGLSQCPLKS